MSDAPVSTASYALDDDHPTTVTTYIHHDPSLSDASLVLAHGAGAGQHHPFMVTVAAAVAQRGIDVVTFDFPYVHAGRKLPDRPPVLEACFLRVLAWTRGQEAGRQRRRIFAGGKSMGGRIATHLGANGTSDIGGVIALGYPLRPPRGGGRDRTTHLATLARPTLVLQGSRDAFGTPEEVRAAMAAAPAHVDVEAVAGADHGFAVRQRPASEVWEQIGQAIAAWIAAQGTH